MKILVLGGTLFLGRHIVQAFLDADHEVTIFHRGQTNPELFARDIHQGQLTRVVGNRDGDLNRLQGLAFDACVDPSGYVPRLVAQSCEFLRETVTHYTFISSISVYSKFVPGQNESGPLEELTDPMTEEVTGETYGGLKVLCEKAVEQAMPGRALHIRAGLLAGPHDPTDRFTYWPVRTLAGGSFVAPVGPELPVQFIDARDVADWIRYSVEAGVTGTYNATGPVSTMGSVLADCISATNQTAAVVWLSEEHLLKHKVTPWTGLPMWLPASARGMMQVGTDKARGAGLVCRPPRETIDGILKTHHLQRDSLVAGLSQAQERALLDHQ